MEHGSYCERTETAEGVTEKFTSVAGNPGMFRHGLIHVKKSIQIEHGKGKLAVRLRFQKRQRFS